MSNDFTLISSDTDLERILNELGLKTMVLAGLTDDNSQFTFAIRGLKGRQIVVESIGDISRPMQVGEEVQIIFGLSDGQYLVRTKIEQKKANFATFMIGKEIYRLQRRNNFRTQVPPKQTLSLILETFKNSPLTPQISAEVIDLSAGGAKIKWPKQLAEPKQGDFYSGCLNLPSGQKISHEGEIKHIGKAENQFVIGVEFQNLSLRDEQSLLFLCMQFHRELLKFIER